MHPHPSPLPEGEGVFLHKHFDLAALGALEAVEAIASGRDELQLQLFGRNVDVAEAEVLVFGVPALVGFKS